MALDFIFAVCDDDTPILNELADQIRRLLLNLLDSAKVLCFQDASALLDFLSRQSVHVLLLDIDMPGINGLEVAAQLLEQKNSPLIIFVTNQDTLVYQSFRYHPFAFIRKTHFQEEIEEVLKRAVTEILKQEEVLCIETGTELLSVRTSQILYFEADGNYVRIQTANNREIRYRATLSNIEERLSKTGFLRIHKGFLVNLRYADALLPAEIRLTDGTLLPVGRKNKEQVREEFLRYMRTR